MFNIRFATDDPLNFFAIAAEAQIQSYLETVDLEQCKLIVDILYTAIRNRTKVSDTEFNRANKALEVLHKYSDSYPNIKKALNNYEKLSLNLREKNSPF